MVVPLRSGEKDAARTTLDGSGGGDPTAVWDDEDEPSTERAPETLEEPFALVGPASRPTRPDGSELTSFLDDAPATPRRTRVIAGRYALHEPLGAGGYGVVHRASDLERGGDVAVKLLSHDAVSAAGGFERFCREVLVLSELDHPGIVKLVDFGETEEGEPFIVCEMLRGRTLEELIEARGRLSLREAAEITEQVLDALAAAHARDIVHRDIKPSNVFLLEDGKTVKLLDFGVARQASVSGNLTNHGEIIGTPSYMAPEQVTQGTIGPPTDLYALGLVMAEAITGEVVMTGKTAVRICMAQGSPDPVPLPACVTQGALGRVITRATSKRYDARFATAADMLEALRGALGADARETLPPAPLVSEVRALAPSHSAPPFLVDDAREASGVVARRTPRMLSRPAVPVAPAPSSTTPLSADDSQPAPCLDTPRARALRRVGLFAAAACLLFSLGVGVGRATSRPLPASSNGEALSPLPGPLELEGRAARAGFELARREAKADGPTVVWSVRRGGETVGEVQVTRGQAEPVLQRVASERARDGAFALRRGDGVLSVRMRDAEAARRLLHALAD